LEHEAIGFAVGDELVHQVFNSHRLVAMLDSWVDEFGESDQ
jgi:hypothetical protein